MFAYFKGKLAALEPALAIVDCHGVGYALKISLLTFEALKGQADVCLYASFQVREDAQTLYGFASADEKALFELLLSVSGIGGNTALTILSSLPPAQIIQAIAADQPLVFERVKGIGKKTAARITLELKDKVGKAYGIEVAGTAAPALPLNTLQTRSEALAALLSLGFAKNMVEKKIDDLLQKTPDIKVEDLIKAALRS